MLGIVLGSPHTSSKVSNGQEKGVGEEVKKSRFFWSRILPVLSTHKRILSPLLFFFPVT